MEKKKEVVCGFVEIDELMYSGDGSGKLIAIASRPGMGKTNLALNLFANMVYLS